MAGDFSGVANYNKKARAFGKKYKIDVPIIKTGKNLKPEKIISNFKDFSPGARQNIIDIAKESNVVVQTKSKPLSSIFKRTGTEGFVDKQFLADAAKFAGRAAQAGFLTPTGVAASTLGLGGLDLTSPVGRLTLGAELAAAPELVKASIGATRGMKNRALQKGIQQFLNLGLPTRLALKAARVASPIGIASLAGEGLYQAGKAIQARKKQLDALTPDQKTELFRKERQQAVMQNLRGGRNAFDEFSAADGGMAGLSGGKKSGPAPISGPTPHGDEGLPAAFKRVKKS